MFKSPRANKCLRVLLTGLFVAGLIAPGRPASAISSHPVIVFGTSLSDPGNAHALRGGTNTAPSYDVNEYLVPTAPYAKGGHHFTNGPTWIEQLGESQGFAESVRGAFESGSPTALNFAVGAARAWEDGTNVNLSAQVAAFLNRAGGVAPSDGLYVIEMGGNDVRDALVAAASGGDPGAVLQEALGSIAGHIGLLYSRGARKFLVWNAPNIALTPAVRILDEQINGAAFAAALLTVAFNQALDQVLNQLQGLQDIEIRRLDAYQLLNGIVANQLLANVTDACIKPNIAPFVCESPDQYTFWDGTHPTRVVHGMVAQQAAFVLAQ